MLRLTYRNINRKDTMNVSEKEFEQIVKEHKGTIYTVCYMFSANAAGVHGYTVLR